MYTVESHWTAWGGSSIRISRRLIFKGFGTDQNQTGNRTIQNTKGVEKVRVRVGKKQKRGPWGPKLTYRKELAGGEEISGRSGESEKEGNIGTRKKQGRYSWADVKVAHQPRIVKKQREGRN